MKQYEEWKDELQSINRKIVLSPKEEQDVQQKMNEKINQSPLKERAPLPWKYYLASAAAVLLLIVIALPFLGNMGRDMAGTHDGDVTQGDSRENQSVTDSGESLITIKISNHTEFALEHVKVNIYKNGQLRHTQGGINADGSATKPGDSFDFQFTTGELSGDVVLEVEVLEQNQQNGVSTNQVSFQLTDEKEYEMELKGTTKEEAYIIYEGETEGDE